MYVIDSSAVLEHGIDIINGMKGDIVIPECVAGELATKGESATLEFLEDSGSIETAESGYLIKVRNAARETGDSIVLSPCDMQVVALALMYRGKVVSADRAILNLSLHLGLDIMDPTGGFKRQIKWYARCSGCGRWFTMSRAEVLNNICPICGSRIRRKVKKND